MDKTLIDSGRKLEADVANAMQRIGISITPEEAATKNWYELANSYGISEENFNRSFKQRKSWEESLRDGEAPLFPETYETLDRLQSEGVQLGLLTRSNEEYTRAKINHFGLQRYFGDRVAITDVKAESKFQEALQLIRQLGPTNLRRAYFIGDKAEDVKVSQPVETMLFVPSKGLYVNRDGLTIPEEVATYRVISSLSEIPEIIRGENER
ncbi:MAG: HAD hydrolase-like protein [Candidatus Pacearchaeota archaeon]|nr:HAD hydrolase-like protein [Candidatus Pacearchaeota archaeon]